MEKEKTNMTFNKLGLKVKENIEIIHVGENEIEVKTFIPFEQT